MVLALESAELQIRCRNLPIPASPAFVSSITLTRALHPQPRQFNLRGFGIPNNAASGTDGAVNKLGQYYCWNRTYDTYTGRWTTPDPVATPWSNLFDYCWSYPIDRSDVNGLVATKSGLAFEMLPTNKDTKCGEIRVQWRWKVPANATGWIVQEVLIRRKTEKCPGQLISEADDRYWEAWRVENGRVFNPLEPYRRPGDIDNFAKSFDGQGGPNTRGYYNIRGYAKFIPDSEMALKPSPSSWTAGVKDAHGLPSTKTKPEGWSRNDTKSHWLYWFWECCGDDFFNEGTWGSDDETDKVTKDWKPRASERRGYYAEGEDCTNPDDPSYRRK